MSEPSLGPRLRARIFGRVSRRESRHIAGVLREETTGGFLLVGAALLALAWANSPFAGAYFALRDLRLGFEPWHLDLTLGAWASDGLLAVFFFLVGLELKRESVVGDLSSRGTAVVPIAAAAGGVLVPAALYVGANLTDPAALRGWAIPTATDIAFAVAVLAVIGSSLPSALRLFLLTLAVVDDLIAIAIIAVFYTSEIQIPPLLMALVPLGIYAFLVQRHPGTFERRSEAAWFLLLPLGAVVWVLVHESGIHATVAGVILGFVVPARRHQDRAEHDRAGDEPGAEDTVVGLAEAFEHRFRPLSAGLAVPVFAFFAAGVTVGGLTGVIAALRDTVAIGIVLGLVVGKPVGILGATWLITRVKGAELDPSLRWVDIVGVAFLAGIGFTVSLLVAELSFDRASPHHDVAKVAIPAASAVAALLAAVILTSRNRAYRALAAPGGGADRRPSD